MEQPCQSSFLEIGQKTVVSIYQSISTSQPQSDQGAGLHKIEATVIEGGNSMLAIHPRNSSGLKDKIYSCYSTTTINFSFPLFSHSIPLLFLIPPPGVSKQPSIDAKKRSLNPPIIHLLKCWLVEMFKRILHSNLVSWQKVGFYCETWWSTPCWSCWGSQSSRRCHGFSAPRC